MFCFGILLGAAYERNKLDAALKATELLNRQLEELYRLSKIYAALRLNRYDGAKRGAPEHTNEENMRKRGDEKNGTRPIIDQRD